MAKPTPTQEPTAPAKATKWKATTRFVEYRGRKLVIKLVDEDNGFEPAKVAMTMNGPAAVSHAHSITFDKDGYVPKTAAEERALLKLAAMPTGHFKGGSLLVLWQNREMPEDQRKAEISASEYRKQVEDLQAQIADKPALDEENRSQAALIDSLQKQLAANKGG
ncbi:MAG: hypothetical protein ABIY63_13375 [Fibrobacteria bacterium]